MLSTIRKYFITWSEIDVLFVPDLLFLKTWARIRLGFSPRSSAFPGISQTYFLCMLVPYWTTFTSTLTCVVQVFFRIRSNYCIVWITAVVWSAATHSTYDLSRTDLSDWMAAKCLALSGPGLFLCTLDARADDFVLVWVCAVQPLSSEHAVCSCMLTINSLIIVLWKLGCSQVSMFVNPWRKILDEILW